MARRYDSTYDWRGIAMLTQQLGQLFEPSKAKIMSQQHEHEMNILMAKQAWDTQLKEVGLLENQYDALQVNINEFENKLYGRDLKELINASMTDGANADEASEVLDKTSGNTLRGLQNTAREYEKMIRQGNETLDTYQLYNATAKVGEKFGTDYKGAKGAKNYLEIHDTEPETPGFLSPDERENVKFDALNTMFLVENVENLKEGTDYMTIHAAGKPVNVRPEALAFVAGFDTDSAEARREKTVKAKAAYDKPQHTLNEWLNLDAAYMNLSQEERKAIDQAIVKPGVAVPPELRDTVEQMKRMNKISVDLAGSKMGEYAQPLPDSVFEPEMKDLSWMPTGDTAVPKEWVEITIGDKKQPGLTKKLYDSLRKLGTNAKDPRKALEYTIRNWEDIAPEKRNAYILQIISQHSGIMAELSK